MMGLQGNDWKQNKDALLEAIVRAGVKVYIPSEFGTNHYITNYPDNKTFAPKAHHFVEAKAKVPKVVAIFPSLMMEAAFFKRLGFDNEKEVWNIVGDGDVPVSLTAKDDVGRFTIETAIMAYQQPDIIPERVVISTVTMPLRDYAAILDKYADTGSKIKVVGKPLPQAKAEWELKKDSIPMGMVKFPLHYCV
jgi:NmrA-like family